MNKAIRNFFKELLASCIEMEEELKVFYGSLKNLVEKNMKLIEAIAKNDYQLFSLEESRCGYLRYSRCLRLIARVGENDLNIAISPWDNAIIVNFEHDDFHPFIEGEKGMQAYDDLETAILEEMCAEDIPVIEPEAKIA